MTPRGATVRETTEQRPTIIALRLIDVEPEDVLWLWPGRIPRGKVTVLDGDPGVGKSQLALDIAARYTRGRTMPDGSPTGMGNVLLLTAEDGLADTVRPRFDALGGDPARLLTATIQDDPGGQERDVTIPDDLEGVQELVRSHAIDLMIVDPFTAFLMSYVNTWRDHDVRRAIRPLAQLADETKAAVVLIRHLNKAGNANALYRGGGSIAIGAAARVVLLAARDPEDDSRRVLATVKNNLSEHAPSLAYHIESAGNGSSRIVWDGESPLTANALVGPLETLEERSKLDEARHFLVTELGDGPRKVKQVRAAARDAGVSDRTLERAKGVMGVRARRTGGLGALGSWVWSLEPNNANRPRPDPSEPPENAKAAKSDIYGGMAPIGDHEAVERAAIQEEEGA